MPWLIFTLLCRPSSKVTEGRGAAAQFLPQDRVVAFAQLKPGELLRESERAMGDAHLQSLHEQLVADRKALFDYERVRPRARPFAACPLLCRPHMMLSAAVGC